MEFLDFEKYCRSGVPRLARLLRYLGRAGAAPDGSALRPRSGIPTAWMGIEPRFLDRLPAAPTTAES